MITQPETLEPSVLRLAASLALAGDSIPHALCRACESIPMPQTRRDVSRRLYSGFFEWFYWYRPAWTRERRCLALLLFREMLLDEQETQP